MGDTVARIRVNNKHYEIVVDLDEAMKVKKGEGSVGAALLANNIFYNTKDGSLASKEDLMAAFDSSDVNEVAEKIIKRGEIELPKEYRDEETEKRRKQAIDYFLRNAIDSRTGRPFTPEALDSAFSQAGVNIVNKPIEQQISAISGAIKTIIPLKIETKKISITIPAIYTGKLSGLINDYKEKEDWMGDGSLKVRVNIPVGLQSEFYDKLNAVTHGAAITEEIKE